MTRNNAFLEIVIVTLCIVSSILLSFYHMSYDGYLGISGKTWDILWAISENALALISSIIIFLFTYGAIKKLFLFFIPYFIVRLIYHISCYSGIYLFSRKKWELIWGGICAIIILLGLIYFTSAIRKHVNH
jgi:hypothetical protein